LAIAANVVLTKAATGQIGVGNINCQPRTYWIEPFGSVDFPYCQAMTEYEVLIFFAIKT